MKSLVIKKESLRPSCPDHGRTVRHGSFRRKEDGLLIQRWRCPRCRKTLSQATGDPFFRQHRRTINWAVAFYLVSGCSQRRLAFAFRANRKTIVRKFLLLGSLALLELKNYNAKFRKSDFIQFDEMESFEHTKCKPLSIPLVVERRSRRILAFDVCSMPAKGPLAKIAVKKYGYRKDDRKVSRRRVLEFVKPFVDEFAVIMTDKNPFYKEEVRSIFPKAQHVVTKGKRGAVTGQGELKKTGFDDLFALNHTCAMNRENINRLRRRTWCTTKKQERLKLHIALYTAFHNSYLVA